MRILKLFKKHILALFTAIVLIVISLTRARHHSLRIAR